MRLNVEGRELRVEKSVFGAETCAMAQGNKIHLSVLLSTLSPQLTTKFLRLSRRYNRGGTRSPLDVGVCPDGVLVSRNHFRNDARIALLTPENP